MWEKLIELREKYQGLSFLQTDIHRDYIRNRFLYETLGLAGFQLSEKEFGDLLRNGKPGHTETTRRVFDLSKAWKYIEDKAARHAPLNLDLAIHTAAKVMKHTGGETTTTVGRYDSSLGDFRLGEDYEEMYPLADYRKIPHLLESLCRTTYARMNQAGAAELIRTAADFMYDFAHIKPFGAGNLETGLLLMNYIVLFRNEPILLIFAEDRPAFLNALKRGKISETPEAFEAFIVQEQIKFLSREL